jgi:hypothetical protein
MPNDSNTEVRLQRRQERYRAPSKGAGAVKLPGSRNRHKSAPNGAGRRSQNQIQADSRANSR